MRKPFLYLPEIQYDRQELKEILETKCKWMEMNGTADAPLLSKEDVPDSIRKFFNYTDPFVTCGYVKVDIKYDLVPHEDEQILAPVFNNPKTLASLPQYYIDWLKIISARDWGISFPVTGDFSNVVTKMFHKHNKEYIDAFSLDVAPTFFRTRGEYLHGVVNTSSEPRILFQLSFKGHDIYKAFEDKIYPSCASKEEVLNSVKVS